MLINLVRLSVWGEDAWVAFNATRDDISQEDQPTFRVYTWHPGVETFPLLESAYWWTCEFVSLDFVYIFESISSFLIFSFQKIHVFRVLLFRTLTFLYCHTQFCSDILKHSYIRLYFTLHHLYSITCLSSRIISTMSTKINLKTMSSMTIQNVWRTMSYNKLHLEDRSSSFTHVLRSKMPCSRRNSKDI